MNLRKTTYRFLLFIVLLITTDQLIGYALDKKYESNKCFFSNGEINNYIQNKSCDTLIIGSSRVLHMINTSVLGANCFNIAKQQKHNYYHTSIIDILNNENKLPRKLLILNIEVEDLFMEKEPSLLKQVSSLSYYYNKNPFVTKFIKNQGWAERIKLLSHIYRHNPNGLKLFTNPIENICLEYPKNGFIPLTPSDNDSIRLAQSLIDDFKPIKNQQINKTILENITHVKTICDKNGIQLLIIDAPYYKVHPAFKIASKKLADFCKKKNIKFIDFKFENIEGLEDKNNWYDNMHTNEKGAQIYTEYLKKKIALQNIE